jgi:hypothetical protein
MIMSDKHAIVDIPLSAEMAEQLRRLLHKAIRSGYGQIEITINPRVIKIVDRTEYRYDRQTEAVTRVSPIPHE